MSHWAQSFYDFQDELTGCYSDPVHPFHRERAAWLRVNYAGRTLLELGSGGGQFAVAAALTGFEVTALEYRAAGTANTHKLAQAHGVKVRAITGDFYLDHPGGPFDLICYWDGFGLGPDEEQRQLLRRLPDWLSPGGQVLIEVYMPYYWVKHAGYSRHTSRYVQTYGFDAQACRFTDTYATAGQEQTQSLRCYTPADLNLLLGGTGLSLREAIPGGQYDPQTQTWHPQASWAECMQWTAVLVAGEDRCKRPEPSHP